MFGGYKNNKQQQIKQALKKKNIKLETVPDKTYTQIPLMTKH